MHINRAASYSFIAGGLHRNRGKYGLHLLHRTVCIKCPEIRCTACRYGLIYCCTFFEESTAWFISVRSAFWHEFRGRSTACFCCCTAWLLALFSREMYGLLVLYICIWFCTEKRKGCWLVCWAQIFQTLWRSLPVEISCIFHYFSVLYIAEENN